MKELGPTGGRAPGTPPRAANGLWGVYATLLLPDCTGQLVTFVMIPYRWVQTNSNLSC